MRIQIIVGHGKNLRDSEITRAAGMVIEREFATDAEIAAYRQALEDTQGFMYSTEATPLPSGLATKILHIEAYPETTNLSEEDQDISGVYAIEVPADLSDHKAASVALDVFHSAVAVEELDNFSFSVKSEQGDVLSEDNNHIAYSASDLGTCHGRIALIPTESDNV